MYRVCTLFSRYFDFPSLSTSKWQFPFRLTSFNDAIFECCVETCSMDFYPWESLSQEVLLTSIKTYGPGNKRADSHLTETDTEDGVVIRLSKVSERETVKLRDARVASKKAKKSLRVINGRRSSSSSRRNIKSKFRSLYVGHLLRASAAQRATRIQRCQRDFRMKLASRTTPRRPFSIFTIFRALSNSPSR